MSDSSLKIILCLLIVLSMSYKKIVEHLFNLASQVSARIRDFLPYHMYLIYYLKKKNIYLTLVLSYTVLSALYH